MLLRKASSLLIRNQHLTFPSSQLPGTSFNLRKCFTILRKTYDHLLSSRTYNCRPLSSTASEINPATARGLKMPPFTVDYTPRDVALYALGTGATLADSKSLRYIYEGHPEFCVLPSYATALTIKAVVRDFIQYFPVPVTVSQMLHAEQYMELLRPMPTTGHVTNTATIVEVLDKGKATVVIVNVDTHLESGEKLAFNQTQVYIMGAGRWGGPRRAAEGVTLYEGYPHPQRLPDNTLLQATSIDQAALYRLSGDPNPIHIDPEEAHKLGLPGCLLHGLATLGFSTRHVLQTCADYDVTKFKAIKVRFTKPVYPGETIQTDIWKEDKRIFFQTKVHETGNVCINQAYIDFH